MCKPSAPSLDHCVEYVGDDAVARIRNKAEFLRGQRVVRMNSTFLADGVVKIILSLARLQNQIGIDTEWRLLRGSDSVFDVTREMHDAIQGGPLDLTDEKMRLYEETMAENALINRFDHDAVYAKLDPNSPYHDPEFPLPVRLGLRAVGWTETSDSAWLESRSHEAA